MTAFRPLPTRPSSIESVLLTVREGEREGRRLPQPHHPRPHHRRIIFDLPPSLPLVVLIPFSRRATLLSSPLLSMASLSFSSIHGIVSGNPILPSFLNNPWVMVFGHLLLRADRLTDDD